jgi:hypothetical protein
MSAAAPAAAASQATEHAPVYTDLERGAARQQAQDLLSLYDFRIYGEGLTAGPFTSPAPTPDTTVVFAPAAATPPGPSTSPGEAMAARRARVMCAPVLQAAYRKQSMGSPLQGTHEVPPLQICGQVSDSACSHTAHACTATPSVAAQCLEPHTFVLQVPLQAAWGALRHQHRRQQHQRQPSSSQPRHPWSNMTAACGLTSALETQNGCRPALEPNLRQQQLLELALVPLAVFVAPS